MMSEEIVLSIIIVNWNGISVLPELLRSLNYVKDYLPWRCEIIIVDNGSSDGSEKMVKKILPSATLICSDVNLGFAGACNLGAKNVESPYILFLNPDTIINPSSLIDVIQEMELEENKSVGICGVQLLDHNGVVMRSCARFPTSIMFLAKNFGLDKMIPEISHSMIEWDHSEDRMVDQVIGAFFLTRGELFHKLQGFDERFFVYFEEVDYSMRARQLGFHTLYYTGAQVTHIGEGTTSQVKDFRLFYSLRSRLLYSKKHFSIPSNVLNYINTLLFEPISRASFLILKRRGSELPKMIKGFKMLYKDLPNITSTRMRP